MDPTPGDLAHLRELYSLGHYRRALTESERFGPLRSWSSTPARLLAGRLAMQLGAPILGRRLHLVAFRSTPSNLEAVYYHARYRCERFGPLACLRFMAKHEDWSDASPDLRADWLGLKAFVAARLRDTDRAEKFLTQAEKLAPNRAWIRVERAAAYEAAERYADAMVAARQALELHPWFRPGVQAAAHLLQRLGKTREAIDLLSEAANHLESGVILAQLASLQIDSEDYSAARGSLDRFEQLSPLLETQGRQWLTARRCDASYFLGERAEAQALAAQVGDEHFAAIAERLASDEAAPAPVRLKLDTGEAAQATVVEMLARHWGEPAPTVTNWGQATDGLPDPAERHSLTAAGWQCIEFTFEPDAVHQALAAGMPIILTLVEVGVAQSRLIVGSDRLRGTVQLLDGVERRPIEVPCSAIFERFAACGPRCLLAVPAAHAGRVPELPYPDRAGYDRLHSLQECIHARDFDGARKLLEEARTVPDSRLCKLTELAWARGTAHPVLMLDAATALLKDYPDDGTFILTRAAALRELGRIDERLELLRAEAAKPQADALILQSLAQMLLINPREQEAANWLLRRSLRIRPHAAAGYYLLASQLWERQQFAEAVELYRLACCLDDREEQFADAYFRVARARNQAPEALRLFQQRATRTESPPAAAVRALFQALVDRDETESAFGMLQKANDKLRSSTAAEPKEPDAVLTPQGELSLFQAEMQAQFGRHDAARRELAALRGRVPAVDWHRTACKIARLIPDPPLALTELRSALVIDPLWMEGRRMCVGLTLEAEGIAAASAQVDALARRFPHYYPIVRMRVEFLTPQLDNPAAIDACRNLLDLCSHDAWALRQMALVLADRGRDEEAKRAIDRAGVLEPNHPSYYAVLAHVHRRDDRIDAAIGAYRAAIQNSVDHELAISELVNLSRGRAEKRESLRFIASQLHRQIHSGDGLVSFRDQMLGLAAADDDADDHSELLEELQDELEQVLEERPDLWQAWSMQIQQLSLMNRLDEAAVLANEATERFPLLSHLWADRARICGALGLPEDRIECLQRAVEASPGWPPAAMELSEALSASGEDAEAAAVLHRAVVRAPGDATAHAGLADRLWSIGESQAAVESVRTAIRFDPGFDAAWRLFVHWCERLDLSEEPAKLARELTRKRPADARGWLRLARLLAEPQHHDEVLAAIDTALQLDPVNVEAHDLRAERLAESGQFDSALAAALPPVLASDMPLVLQGRAAWVEAKRGNYAAAIPSMQKLVSVEPEYFWGWQQLAEWYSETGKNENFLESSSQLVRLKPEHPLPLTMRGEAKLKTGDRAGGKEDLRDALRLAPQYAPAAMILFDACLADGEAHDARKALAVLQEHAVGVEVLAKQVQLACRTSECESALRSLAEIAESPGDRQPLALQIALAELANCGWELKASRVLRTAWQSSSTFNPWVPIYWLDTPDGESAPYEDRMGAIDAAIDAYPNFAPAHDRKAELLALVGRFDEALAACQPPVFDGNVPITLRGRAAWVEARRGRRGHAIALMDAAVKSDKEYLWGWRNLAQWYDLEGRYRECHEAADQMVKLSPDDPLAYGYRGEARRSLGDRRGAMEDFRKAFELDSRFEAAGLQLITEQLHAREVDEAIRTLARLEEHANGPLVLLRGVQVAAAHGDLDAARRKFRQLAAEQQLPPELLTDAATAFDESGWEDEADDELTRAALGDRSTVAAAVVWTDRQMQSDREMRVLDALPTILQSNPTAGREAVLIYSIASVKAGRGDAAASVIHRFADELRPDDTAWAVAGRTLSQAGLHALAVNWLSDWRMRTMVEPEMLRPLADSLRALDRDHDALTICRDALELGGEPPADMLAWLALAAATEGRTTDAAQSLNGIDKVGLNDGVRLLVALAESLVMVQQAGPDAKAAAFAEAKDHLRTAAGSCDSAELPLGVDRWYRRVVQRLAADSGLFSARCWSAWQRLRPWL